MVRGTWWGGPAAMGCCRKSTWVVWGFGRRNRPLSRLNRGFPHQRALCCGLLRTSEEGRCRRRRSVRLSGISNDATLAGVGLEGHQFRRSDQCRQGPGTVMVRTTKVVDEQAHADDEPGLHHGGEAAETTGRTWRRRRDDAGRGDDTTGLNGRARMMPVRIPEP